MERSSRGRARSAPKLFHAEAAAETPSHGPKPWDGVLHNGIEVEFMRIERLQEALEGLGLDTAGKRFNLLQRLAAALGWVEEDLGAFVRDAGLEECHRAPAHRAMEGSEE